jgi:hypothetical protein
MGLKRPYLCGVVGTLEKSGIKKISAIFFPCPGRQLPKPEELGLEKVQV